MTKNISITLFIAIGILLIGLFLGLSSYETNNIGAATTVPVNIVGSSGTTTPEYVSTTATTTSSAIVVSGTRDLTLFINRYGTTTGACPTLFWEYEVSPLNQIDWYGEDGIDVASNQRVNHASTTPTHFLGCSTAEAHATTTRAVNVSGLSAGYFRVNFRTTGAPADLTVQVVETEE